MKRYTCQIFLKSFNSIYTGIQRRPAKKANSNIAMSNWAKIYACSPYSISKLYYFFLKGRNMKPTQIVATKKTITDKASIILSELTSTGVVVGEF